MRSQALLTLLIAPQGIEIAEYLPFGSMLLLLIAPQGIEIYELKIGETVGILLIAPQGIEIAHRFALIFRFLHF